VKPLSSRCASSFIAALVAVLSAAAGPANGAIAIYDYRVVEKRPQPRENFVQGLQIVDDTLYIGTGMHGQSRLREYDFPAMTLRREIRLDEQYFGEGITRLGDRIFQLTWRAGLLFEYDAESLKLLREHRIPTQGWGITHNGSELIYSDGSATLYFLDPETLTRHRSLAVTLNNRPLPRLNELEWIEGEIWANVWQANQLVRIDPDSGQVLGVVDLRGLLEPTDRQADTDVLNGIAWDSGQRALWVTGKRWPWLFQIELTGPRPAAQP
jgi:glutamine cyclotransferase